MQRLAVQGQPVAFCFLASANLWSRPQKYLNMSRSCVYSFICYYILYYIWINTKCVYVSPIFNAVPASATGCLFYFCPAGPKPTTHPLSQGPSAPRQHVGLRHRQHRHACRSREHAWKWSIRAKRPIYDRQPPSTVLTTRELIECCFFFTFNLVIS